MEALAINSASYATAQVVGGVHAPNSASRQTREDVAQQSAATVETNTEQAKQAAFPKKPAEEREVTKATANQQTPSVGRIRFELDDGTRVAKVFDTKDILIYQVPPEGSVYLVRLQEEAGQDQVETSA